jgi:Ca2+-binding EF-hand superfamily protein
VLLFVFQLHDGFDFSLTYVQNVEVFIEAFREFDVDGSGTIDTSELLAAFKSMGQGCTPDQAKKLISKYDNDGNGVDFENFLKVLQQIVNCS